MNSNLTIQLSPQQLELLRKGESINITISLDAEEKRKPAINSGNHDKSGHQLRDQSFLKFFRQQIERLKSNGNARTSETYQATYNKCRVFLQGHDIAISSIDSNQIEGLQAFLRGQGLSMNTISFYMRITRAVYNRAVEQGMALNLLPFQHAFTGSQKTVKRALSLDEIRRIKRLHLTNRDEGFARDLFLFSFYTRGMSFVDIAYLKKTDVHDGVVAYIRKKTGRMLTIRWEQCIQQIVNRYPSKTKYLLPIIHTEGSCERNQYRTVQDRINRLLKSIGDKAEIRQNLTMYCARHSWATIAREQKIPISVISHAMGHTNERTTEVYLKSIDSAVIDNCNREIISLLE